MTIDRRHFIVTGSAAVAGLAVRPLAADTVAAPHQLFVGFAPLVARSRAVGGTGAAIYPADSIRRTEASFIRTGARMSIRRLRQHDSRPLRLHLDVLFEVDGQVEKAPFLAWTYDSSTRNLKQSAPVAFRVPVDPVKTLDLNLVFVTPEGPVSRTVSLTVATPDPALALNPGAYVFALAERQPAWSTLVIDGEALRDTWGAPAAFDYLMLRVSTPRS